jgi:hypothetical protein
LKRRRIVVVGTLASNPYAGMAWMHMQITAGLCRLGHDAYYFETTSNWPYDPIRNTKVGDSDIMPALHGASVQRLWSAKPLGIRPQLRGRRVFGLPRTKPRI